MGTVMNLHLSGDSSAFGIKKKKHELTVMFCILGVIFFYLCVVSLRPFSFTSVREFMAPNAHC
jgi:hypothetical protein